MSVCAGVGICVDGRVWMGRRVYMCARAGVCVRWDGHVHASGWLNGVCMHAPCTCKAPTVAKQACKSLAGDASRQVGVIHNGPDSLPAVSVAMAGHDRLPSQPGKERASANDGPLSGIPTVHDALGNRPTGVGGSQVDRPSTPAINPCPKPHHYRSGGSGDEGSGEQLCPSNRRKWVALDSGPRGVRA